MAEIPRLVSQPRSPARANVPTVSRRAALAPFEAVQDIGEVISRDGAQFLLRLNAARQASELTRAQAAATLGLAELEAGFDQDTDFATMEERFKTGVEELRGRTLEGIEDDAVRQQFTREFNILAQSKIIAVRRKAFKLESDSTIATLDSLVPEYARLAATAGSDLERDMVIAQGNAAIANLAAAGFITQQDAVKRQQDFLSSVDEAGARAIITADPEEAVSILLDPDELPNLDPVSRSRLTDTAVRRADAVAAERARAAEKAEREADRARSARADSFMKDLFDRDSRGELTRERVEEVRPDLDASQYRTALKLLEPDSGTVRDDRDTLLEVYTELGRDPLAGRALARQRFAAGLLSNETYKSIEGNAERFEDETFRAGKQFIERSLAPGDLIADPAQRQRAAQAVDEYRVWFLGGERTPEEARAEQQEVVRRFRLFGTGEPLLVPPQPRSGRIDFLGGDLEVIAAQIEAAEDRFFDAMTAGAVDPAVVQLEAQSLTRARHWLEQERVRAEAARQERRKDR